MPQKLILKYRNIEVWRSREIWLGAEMVELGGESDFENVEHEINQNMKYEGKI